MRYLIVLCSSLTEAFLFSVVFGIFLPVTDFVSAFLVMFVAVWFGFLCARLVVRYRPLVKHLYIPGMVTGVALGIISAWFLCDYNKTGAETLDLIIGATIGLVLSLTNILVWSDYDCI